MRKNRFFSLVIAVAMAMSMFPSIIMTAHAASTTYVWDFTDSTWFSAAINAGKNIISNQNETTVIMTNPGAKLTYSADGKVEGYTLVTKVDALAANAVNFVIPAGESASISMQLACGSGKDAAYLRDSSGNAVIDMTGHTKNVFTTYTADLSCGEEYTLDTTAGKPYMGRVELTVVTEGGGDDNPPATTPPATNPPITTDTPNVTEPPATELQKMDYKMSFTFDKYKDDKYTAPVLLKNEDGDPCMKVYATEKKDVQVNGSNKTIGSTKFSTRLRMRGEGSVEEGYRCVEMIPAKAGSITVSFGHPSSSDPNARTLYLRQGDERMEAQVASNSETEAKFIVKADVSVYLYGNDDLGIYGVTYKPGDTATPPPSSGTDDPEEAAKADAQTLKFRALSQNAIYFDIDLPKTGDNGSQITWESSNTKYIDIQMVSSINRNYTGIVTRPEADSADIVNGGVPVTLTATVKNGDASVKKTFDVSVRAKGDVVYYNDFQQDVGKSAEGGFNAIADNVIPAMTADKEQKLDDGETNWRSEPFRGIRIDTLKEARAFAQFKHNDKDTPSYFDKRLMSTNGTKFGNPADSSGEKENFVFYYSEYAPVGGTSSVPLWIDLVDEATGLGPAGIVMMSMDIYVANGKTQLSLGLANSSPSQMCRFMLGSDHGKTFSGGGNTYTGAGYLRTFNNEASADFMGGTDGYRVPENEWIKAIIVANTDSHKWDLYFNGMQIAAGLDFRNAEDCVSAIEFSPDRNRPGSEDAIAVYLIDNIYVENLTDDYSESYWDSLGIDALKYDKSSDTYTTDGGKSFLLQYQGTEGLSGNYLSWTSSNTSALSIKTQRIPVGELLNYGYTQAQVNGYLANGVRDVAVVKAIPGKVSIDTTVTVTAVMKVGNDEMTKKFTVIVKQNSDGSDNIGGSDGGSGGGGGAGMTNPNAINGAATPSPTTQATMLPQAPTLQVQYDDGVFSDIEQAPWARDAIMYLYSQDIVNGYGDGLYGVSDSVTREQFVKMLLAALELPLYKNDTPTFSDVEHGSWYEYSVETAAKLGIVSGISDTEFGVGMPISRQDMAVMIKRALDYLDSKKAVPTDMPKEADENLDAKQKPDASKEPDATDAPEETEDGVDAEQESATSAKSSFTDSNEISFYAVSAIAEMAANGFINGYDDGAFRPLNSLTRAETAVVLYRIICREV